MVISVPAWRDAQDTSGVLLKEARHRHRSPHFFQSPSSISFSTLSLIVIFAAFFSVDCSNTHLYAAATNATLVCDPPCQNDGVCTPESLESDSENRIRRRTETSNEKGVCECTEGFGGDSCEAMCTLKCYNGGKCNPYLQVGGLTSCECPKGYEGRQCDIEICGNVFSSCLNGGTCAERGKGDYECDCTASHGAYAGPQCEYEATTFCAVDGSPSETLFCVNGGKCVDKVPHQKPHKGCNCLEGYTGEHCQYIMELPRPEMPRPGVTRPEKPRTISPRSESGTNPITEGYKSGNMVSILFFVAFLVSTTAVFACAFMTFYSSWKMRRHNSDALGDLTLWGLDSGMLEDLGIDSSSVVTDALTDDGTEIYDDVSNKDEDDNGSKKISNRAQ